MAGRETGGCREPWGSLLVQGSPGARVLDHVRDGNTAGSFAPPGLGAGLWGSGLLGCGAVGATGWWSVVPLPLSPAGMSPWCLGPHWSVCPGAASEQAGPLGPS